MISHYKLANKPETIPELKYEIEGVIGEIQPHLEKVMENFIKRVIRAVGAI